jgi:hypothetical protein
MYRTYLRHGSSYVSVMANKTDDSLNFDCPICGATTGRACVTAFGFPRNQSHLRRRDIAKEFEMAVRRLESQVGRPVETHFDY